MDVYIVTNILLAVLNFYVGYRAKNGLNYFASGFCLALAIATILEK